MTAVPSALHRVTAYNTAHAAENKIHDDAVARRFGFAGGLVPGADVYAYMTHLPVARWGRAWIERGCAECRFGKPVYDGHIATVTAVETGDRLTIEVESDDVVCATGQASLGSEPPVPPPLDGFKIFVPPADRPPADEITLAPGTWFGIAPFRLTADYAAEYLREVRETHPLYASDGLAHPGIFLRLGNWTLRQNVELGPWIHVGSRVEHFAAARVGDEFSVRACVTANYERKGHRLVDLDVLVIANGRTAVARVAHTAIYRPRQVAAPK